MTPSAPATTTGRAGPVIAEVALRSPAGSSVFDPGVVISRATVDRYRAEPGAVDMTRQRLAGLGIQVLSASRTSMTVRADRDDFEKAFRTRLRIARTGTRPAVEFFAVASGNDNRPLPPPDDLTGLIAGAALTRPAEYLHSAFPPITAIPAGGYRWLFLPGELAGVLRAAPAHRRGVTGSGIRVAIVDSGCYRHEYFAQYGFNLDEVVPTGSNLDEWPDAGHGTAMAANVFAIAPDARVTPVWMGASPAEALRVAANPRPNVINCSWGLADDDSPGGLDRSFDAKIVAAVIAELVDEGIVICFAAGNGSRRIPAGHPDVISVGGVHVDLADPREPEASGFASSFGSQVWPERHVPDVCGLVGRPLNGGAPLLMLPVPPGSELDNVGGGWGTFSGTSAATAQLTGIVALMLQVDPELPPDEVRQLLKDTAMRIDQGVSATGEMAPAATGAGLVDAGAAVNAVGVRLQRMTAEAAARAARVGASAGPSGGAARSTGQGPPAA
jgi:subtilisin family serine protease